MQEATPFDIYLIDFGMAKRYVDGQGNHVPFSKGRKFRGTYQWTSTNIDQGMAPSRRDDLWSLGYMLVYLRTGFLPWIIIGGEGKDIMAIKARTSIQKLCKNLHPSFLRYFEILERTKFAEEPDYKKLIACFLDIFKESNLK